MFHDSDIRHFQIASLLLIIGLLRPACFGSANRGVEK